MRQKAKQIKHQKLYKWKGNWGKLLKRDGLVWKKANHSGRFRKEYVCFWKRNYNIVNVWSYSLTHITVYTFFALCEYVVVVADLLFRGTLAYDLKGTSLMIAYKNKFRDCRRKSHAGWNDKWIEVLLEQRTLKEMYVLGSETIDVQSKLLRR